MADASVRPARAADAGSVARIQLDTWRTAYAAILPPEALADLDQATAAAVWGEAITAPDSRVVVATENEAVVGFAAVRTDTDPRPAVAEVTALVVEPRYGRRGHGSRLLAALVERARADGQQSLTAWVPERDAALSGLLGAAGWERDGYVRTLEDGAMVVREVRLHTDIRESAA